MGNEKKKIVWYYVVSVDSVKDGNQEITVIHVPDEKVQHALELRTQIKESALGSRQLELRNSLWSFVNEDQIPKTQIKIPGTRAFAGSIVETTPPSDELPFPLGVVTAYPSQPDSTA